MVLGITQGVRANMLGHNPLKAVTKTRKPAGPRQDFRGKIAKSISERNLGPSGLECIVSFVIRESATLSVLLVALVLAGGVGTVHCIAESAPAQIHTAAP